MANIPQVAACLQKVLNEEAVIAGVVSGFVKRERKLSAPIFVQTTVLGWLANAEASLEELTQTTAALGIKISPQALDQRFNQEAAECLRLVLEKAVEQVIAAEGVAVSLLQKFAGVKLFDTTTILLPKELAHYWVGCGGSKGKNAALKLDLSFDLLTGQLQGPYLLDGRSHDSSGLARLPLPEAVVRIADLAYFDAASFTEIDKAGAYWLSRLKARTIIYDEQGRKINIPKMLKKCCPDRLDIKILLTQNVPTACRLIAWRVPKAVAKQRRTQLIAEAVREGKEPSVSRLALVNWSIYVTNAPYSLLTIDEVGALARARWQVELLFKLWKSHGLIDESRSNKAWRILCEVYAKMIAMIIQHWIILVSCWHIPNRSFLKAAQTIRKQAFYLAAVFHSFAKLREALQLIARCLAAGCRISKRKRAPANFQLLLAEALN